jgi:hypothetical protein
MCAMSPSTQVTSKSVLAGWISGSSSARSTPRIISDEGDMASRMRLRLKLLILSGVERSGRERLSECGRDIIASWDCATAIAELKVQITG